MRYQPVKRPRHEIGYEDRTAKLAKIKIGDKVWVGESHYPCSRGIQEVTRMTATLILVGKHNFQRFKKDDGYQVGRGMFSQFISGIATKEEIEEYEAEERRKKAEADRRRKRQESIENTQKDLNTLFPDDEPIYVRADDFNKSDMRFTITVSGLTEEQVRALAPKLRKAVAGK